MEFIDGVSGRIAAGPMAPVEGSNFTKKEFPSLCDPLAGCHHGVSGIDYILVGLPGNSAPAGFLTMENENILSPVWESLKNF